MIYEKIKVGDYIKRGHWLRAKSRVKYQNLPPKTAVISKHAMHFSAAADTLRQWSAVRGTERVLIGRALNATSYVAQIDDQSRRANMNMLCILCYSKDSRQCHRAFTDNDCRSYHLIGSGWKRELLIHSRFRLHSPDILYKYSFHRDRKTIFSCPISLNTILKTLYR